MGQARAAMRAAGHARLAPVEVLDVLDAQLSDVLLADDDRPGLLSPGEQPPPRFATACYAILDPGSRSLRIANAGHVPLMVRAGSGLVRTVRVPPGPPLGLGIGGFAERTEVFEPGDTLLMFTDGLVESRELDLDVGLATLAEAFARHGDDSHLDALADRLIEAMNGRPGHGDDDIALVLVRLDDPSA
jgi:serine phosphatase RsbU (regulator of sigma subunit)